MERRIRYLCVITIKKMNNVIVRSLSGIIYIALVIGCLLAGGWWMTLFALFLGVVGMLEYQTMTSLRTHANVPRCYRLINLVFGAFIITMPMIMPGMDYPSEIVMAMLLLYMLAQLSAVLFVKVENSPAVTAWSVAGLLYIALPLSILTWLTVDTAYGWQVVLAMFVMIWLNDTGAFCFGSMFGRRKLCERLSPKKSWEGFWGGMFTAVVAAVVYAACNGANVWMALGTAVAVSVLSTWGDLYESLLKRTANVKDAGHIMPGHGGVLDRIDSLLFVMLAVGVAMLVWPEVLAWCIVG